MLFNSDGTVELLGDASISNYYAQGYFLNNQGWVAGLRFSVTQQYQYQTMLWRDGQEIAIGTLGLGGIRNAPRAINDNGWIVGFETDREFGYTWGWLWTELSGIRELPIDPYDVNDQNVIAGFSPRSRPCLYRDGEMIELWPPGPAVSINNNGQVIIYSDSATDTYLFHEGVSYRILDLIVPEERSEFSRLRWENQGRPQINDRGEILCHGLDTKGRTWTLLLRPVDRGPPQSIPRRSLHGDSSS